MKPVIFLLLLLQVLLTSRINLYCQEAKALRYAEAFDMTLENGLRVILIEHREQPAIIFHLHLPVGTWDDPVDKKGLTAMTADLLEFGTSTKSEEEIETSIDQIGGQYSIKSDATKTDLVFGCLSKDTNQAVELFADIIMNPTMPTKKLSWVRERYLERVRSELSNNYKQLYRYQTEVLFGTGDPRGMSMTVKSIKAIDSASIHMHYKTLFRPEGAILIVIGQFEKASLLDLLKATLGNWKSEVPMPTAADTIAPVKPMVGRRIINKPHITQVFFNYSRLIHQTDPDEYYAWQLLAYILAFYADPTTRLNVAVRQNAGKTYALWSNYDVSKGYGVLDIHFSTRNAEFLKTHLIVTAELKKMLQEGISEQELNNAKEYISGALPLTLEHPGSIAEFILSGMDRGITLKEIPNEIQKYQQVTTTQVNKALREYLDPDNLCLVVWGDKKEIKDQLDKIGTFEVRDFEDLLF